MIKVFKNLSHEKNLVYQNYYNLIFTLVKIFQNQKISQGLKKKFLI